MNYKYDLTLEICILVFFYPFLRGGFCAFNFSNLFFFLLLSSYVILIYIARQRLC